MLQKATVISLHYQNKIVRIESWMSKRLLAKPFWKNALGAKLKPKRLKLVADSDGFFVCPIVNCDSEKYRSIRGCRKHVFSKHGWFYYFDEKPDISSVFPSLNTRVSSYKPQKRVRTSNMPMFVKTSIIGQNFKKWLKSPGGGGKSETQADQVMCKNLKYLKYCCSDVAPTWEVRESVVDYCLGSLTMLSDFVESLQGEWKMGYSGIIGYMNSVGHMLDYRRSCTDFTKYLRKGRWNSSGASF